MYLIAMAWIYVAVMMAAAEAAHPTGSVLGALVTFLLYGLLPVTLFIYLMGGKFRRRARAREEASLADEAPAQTTQTLPSAQDAGSVSPQPDRSGQAAGHAVAPEGKEA